MTQAVAAAASSLQVVPVTVVVASVAVNAVVTAGPVGRTVGRRRDRHDRCDCVDRERD